MRADKLAALKSEVQRCLTKMRASFQMLQDQINQKHTPEGFPGNWAMFAFAFEDDISPVVTGLTAMFNDESLSYYKGKKALAQVILVVENARKLLGDSIADVVEPQLDAMVKEAKAALKAIETVFKSVAQAVQADFGEINLQEWLAKTQDSAQVNAVLENLKSLGYDDNALSNLHQCLSTHGRLFLNCLKRACEQASIQAISFLDPLAQALEVIETASPPPAHFIWVGPPSKSDNELLGVRALPVSAPLQKINFWVLDEYVVEYQKRFHDLGLSNVNVVSIEEYAKKIDLKFGEKRDSSLLNEIEFFKKIAAENIALANACPDGSYERNVAQTNAIRDRVTIVDHVKPLIALFEGGYVFDSDIIVSLQAGQVLPELGKWVFPGLNPVEHDIWFFFCHPSLTWRGEDARYIEDVGELDEIRLERNLYLCEYNKKARKIYLDHTDPTKRESFPAFLGSAIMRMGNQIPRGTFGDKERELQRKLSSLNSYIITEQPQAFWISSREGKDEGADFKLYEYAAHILKLSTRITLVKYLSQSYVLKKPSRDGLRPAGIHLALLLIRAPEDFEIALVMRNRLTKFNLGYVFDVAIFRREDGGKFLLRDITMLHVSLFVRPDLFGIILNELPLKALPTILRHEVRLSEAFLGSPNSDNTVFETLLDIANFLLQKVGDARPILKNLLLKASEKIKTAMLVSTIYEKLPEKARQQWADKKDPDVILNAMLAKACVAQQLGMFYETGSVLKTVLQENFGVEDFRDVAAIKSALFKKIDDAGAANSYRAPEVD